MTEYEIKKEFAKATTFPELAIIANRLKKNGEAENKINKVMTQRRNQIIRESKGVPTLLVVPVARKKFPSEPTTFLNLNPINFGNEIIYDGEVITIK